MAPVTRLELELAAYFCNCLTVDTEAAETYIKLFSDGFHDARSPQLAARRLIDSVPRFMTLQNQVRRSLPIFETKSSTTASARSSKSAQARQAEKLGVTLRLIEPQMSPLYAILKDMEEIWIFVPNVHRILFNEGHVSESLLIEMMVPTVEVLNIRSVSKHSDSYRIEIRAQDIEAVTDQVLTAAWNSDPQARDLTLQKKDRGRGHSTRLDHSFVVTAKPSPTMPATEPWRLAFIEEKRPGFVDPAGWENTVKTLFPENVLKPLPVLVESIIVQSKWLSQMVGYVENTGCTRGMIVDGDKGYISMVFNTPEKRSNSHRYDIDSWTSPDGNVNPKLKGRFATPSLITSLLEGLKERKLLGN